MNIRVNSSLTRFSSGEVCSITRTSSEMIGISGIGYILIPPSPFTSLAASVQNQCEFCTAAHRAIGKMKQASQQSLDAIYAGEPVEDPQDAALAGFTQTVVESRGKPGEAAINAFMSAGFTKQQILEVMLIVSIKTLSNYINHLTNPEPNPELLAMIGENVAVA